jgi:hypothetical protein
MVSMYVEQHFIDKLKDSRGEAAFDEKEYTLLFNHTKDDNALEGIRNNNKNLKTQEVNKFFRKSSYNEKDLRDFYENIRFTTPFMVYRNMEWWPYIDILASYGHFISNFIIMYSSIYLNVSLLMMFNVCCVCIFYGQATYKLNQKATFFFRDSGI